MIPETRYAKTADGVYIAYRTVGNGPLDLVLVCYLLHIEHIWTWPVAASFLRLWGTDTRVVGRPTISYHPPPCSTRSFTRSSDAFSI